MEPSGEICTIVVPVPCRFAALLKLLTRMFPLVSEPAVAGMTATPYGLTSPLAGTVEATTLIVDALAGTSKMPAVPSATRTREIRVFKRDAKGLAYMRKLLDLATNL